MSSPEKKDKDLSADELNEEELNQSFFNNLMAHTTDAIYFKNLKSEFLRISNQHAKIFGLSNPESAKGKSDFDFFTKEHAQQAYNDEQKIIKSKQHLQIEEHETWRDGHRSYVFYQQDTFIGSKWKSNRNFRNLTRHY